LVSPVPYDYQLCILTRSTIALTIVIASSNANNLSVLCLSANRTSAIAPTISCPRGPYAFAAIVDKRITEIARSRLRQGADFIFRPRDSTNEFRVARKSSATIVGSAAKICANLFEAFLKFWEM